MTANLPALTDEQRTELTDSRSDFTAEDRVAIAMAYITSGGNAEKAAHRATAMIKREVKASTLRQWRRRSWWPGAEEMAKKWLQIDLENKYTRFLIVTEQEMLDRVENGDTRLDKAGEPVRVPVSLRDLVGAHAVVSDKRAMIRGEPTSRKEDSGLALAHKLAEALQGLGEKRISDMPTPIEGEFDVWHDGKFTDVSDVPSVDEVVKPERGSAPGDADGNDADTQNPDESMVRRPAIGGCRDCGK